MILFILLNSATFAQYVGSGAFLSAAYTNRFNRLTPFVEKGAFNTGFQRNFQLTETTALNVGIGYEFQRATSDVIFVGHLGASAKVVLQTHAVCLPLLVEFTLKEAPSFYFGLGTHVNYLLNKYLKTNEEAAVKVSQWRGEADLQRFEIGALFAFGYKVKLKNTDQLRVEVRSRLLNSFPISIRNNDYVFGTVLHLSWLITKKS